MNGDVVVIGGGPGGYVAAIRAAQLGASVILVEKDRMGGTCLNVGCIPTKSLLKSVEAYHEARHLNDFGITADGVRIDFDAVQKRKDRIVQTLVSGVDYLMKKNKIRIVQGEAVLKSRDTVQVVGAEEAAMQASKVILATGARPIELASFRFDHEDILDSTDILKLAQPPESLLIIGGGVIAVEMASIYSELGTRVIIVETMNHLVPNEDEDMIAPLHHQLRANGVEIYLNTKAVQYEKNSGKLDVALDIAGSPKQVQVEKVLVAVGRKPNLEAVGLLKEQISCTNGKIDVNDRMETSIPGIYAAGDVIGGYQLAHVAFQEGIIAAENACGMNSVWDQRAIPRCIYTMPEIAAVGLTEKSAKIRYDKINAAVFPFKANAKALIDGTDEGLMKIISHPETGEILGGAVVGAKASEIIAQIGSFIHMAATVEDIELLIPAHPTVSEAFKEAALMGIGKAIHF